ncbi:MAG: ABC transporter ATP-binding protein [Desulfobacterales bacterium]|nr:ABC transporter ATP-binding protein [Desulfobacterales bacterium]
MSFIEVKNLVKQYGTGEAAVAAVNGISFTVEPGEFVAVMGPSGAGKSTLLSVMGAMNAPTKGRYAVDGIDVYSLRPEQRADFRREFLGFVFQGFHLVDYLTVLENVMLPLAVSPGARQEKDARAKEALAWVGLADKASRLPGEISGGEKERAAIARAIVNEPPLLLADEPTGSLDSSTGRDVMELILRLNRQGTTVLMVTHSSECAGYAARRLLVTDGRLASDVAGEAAIAGERRNPGKLSAVPS